MGLIGRLLGRRSARWTQEWAAYPADLGDDSKVYIVDLGAVAAAPVLELPIRLDVEARYAAGPDGMPDAATLADLERLDGVLDDAVHALGGHVVGRVTGSGVRLATAHLPAEPAAALPLPTGPRLAVTTATQYDPQWAYVRDSLAPDERQAHIVNDLALIAVLDAQGDELGAPRPLAHAAYFDGTDPAEGAAGELRTIGFAVTVERDDEGLYALTAVRTDPVRPPAVHEVTWSVKTAADRHGGTYDGWSCLPPG
ncbi:hypothetical protein GCM10009682_22510 [Luedemannella flava]|uniref:DUF695 domain-containing protein n=1 Tax=Luedemannella flava TaxID=349316 RepID=A0ABN2LVE4_9ACTN